MSTVIDTWIKYELTSLFRKLTYDCIRPGFINVGNLVELQVSVCSVPTGRDKNLFIVKLRSLCVLSRKVEWVRRKYAYKSELSA